MTVRLRRWLSVVALSGALIGCKQGLLDRLDQHQANEVLAALQRNNISASKVDKGKAGYAIDVSPTDFAAAVDLLKIYHLPSRARIDIDKMFPADSLVSSSRAEKARLYSAIEQRLEQSLAAIPNVVSARVDISYDTRDSDENAKSLPMHVSALAVYEQNIDPSSLISDIKRFLKNSFADLSYDNISVVVSKRSPLQHRAPSTADETQSRLSLPTVSMAIGGVGVVATLLVGGWLWIRHRQRQKPEFTDKVGDESDG